jgi:hypothetical protein
MNEEPVGGGIVIEEEPPETAIPPRLQSRDIPPVRRTREPELEDLELEVEGEDGGTLQDYLDQFSNWVRRSWKRIRVCGCGCVSGLVVLIVIYELWYYWWDLMALFGFT